MNFPSCHAPLRPCDPSSPARRAWHSGYRPAPKCESGVNHNGWYIAKSVMHGTSPSMKGRSSSACSEQAAQIRLVGGSGVVRADAGAPSPRAHGAHGLRQKSSPLQAAHGQISAPAPWALLSCMDVRTAYCRPIAPGCAPCLCYVQGTAWAGAECVPAHRQSTPCRNKCRLNPAAPAFCGSRECHPSSLGLVAGITTDFRKDFYTPASATLFGKGEIRCQ